MSYKAANPPISGLGLAAVRDITAFAKHEAQKRVKYAIGLGVSQSGRFLRTFLYDGMNTDEKGRQVFDGVMAHIAGGARLDVNRRWATPTGLGTYAATAFPFADVAQKDPVSGVTDGLLDNPRARHEPAEDLLHEHRRRVLGRRTIGRADSHDRRRRARTSRFRPTCARTSSPAISTDPSAFPPPAGQGQQKANPTDYWWNMRALVVCDGEVGHATARCRPPSQYPQASERHAGEGVDGGVSDDSRRPVAAHADGRHCACPPNSRRASAGAGAPLPFLVPQVDADGNERAGIRLPEVTVPLATYTGWNFRNSRIGGTDQLVSLLGSYIPFAQTKAEREATHDPRPSIEERYASRDQYMDQINKAAAALVKDGYLLADDVPSVTKRAADHWEYARETKN